VKVKRFWFIITNKKSNMSTTPIYQLIYLSTGNHPFSLTDIEQLCFASQQRNKMKSITGVLVYSSPHFLQYIEGDEGDINELFQKISGDKRHTNIRIIKRSTTEFRNFGQWDMKCFFISKDAQELLASIVKLVDSNESVELSLFQQLIASLE
jgi:hypothetical protein